MPRMLSLCVVMLGSAAGCGEARPWEVDARPPLVEGLSPNARASGQGGETVVHGRFLKPSYNAFLDEETPVAVTVGGVTLEVLAIDSSGTRLTVRVPSDLAVGLHDATVRTAHGSDTLERAYLVCAGEPCPP